MADGIGRFDAIAFHPTNANIIYTGSTSGGIFKNNQWWLKLDSIIRLFTQPFCSRICVHPTNTNIIYALSGDSNTGDGYLVEEYQYRTESQGVFKTNDGGDTWFAVDTIRYHEFQSQGFNHGYE